MNEPRPLDLSDKALFGPLDGEARARREAGERLGAAVEAAFGIFRGASLRLPYAWDQDDAWDLWVTSLIEYQPEAITTAAGEWVRTAGAEFPTLAEFETLVASKQRTLDAPPPAERAPGESCPECGATEDDPGGWVYLTDPSVDSPNFGAPADVRPCSLCRPEQHDLWQGGHFMPGNGGKACRCKARACRERRARHQASKR
jgi:hypothetical protein